MPLCRGSAVSLKVHFVGISSNPMYETRHSPKLKSGRFTLTIFGVHFGKLINTDDGNDFITLIAHINGVHIIAF